MASLFRTPPNTMSCSNQVGASRHCYSYLLYNLVNFTELVKPKEPHQLKPPHPPSLSLFFPHPNNKYQTSCIKYVKALQFVLKWKMNHKPFKKICTEYSTTEHRGGFKSPNHVFSLLSCFQLDSADLSTKREKYYT